MSQNDGGPAFPSETERDAQGRVIATGYVGMSLRDWFAGQALAGYFANPENNTVPPHVTARDCYAIADALLLERALPPENRSA